MSTRASKIMCTPSSRKLNYIKGKYAPHGQARFHDDDDEDDDDDDYNDDNDSYVTRKLHIACRYDVKFVCRDRKP